MVVGSPWRETKRKKRGDLRATRLCEGKHREFQSEGVEDFIPDPNVATECFFLILSDYIPACQKKKKKKVKPFQLANIFSNIPLCATFVSTIIFVRVGVIFSKWSITSF